MRNGVASRYMQKSKEATFGSGLMDIAILKRNYDYCYSIIEKVKGCHVIGYCDADTPEIVTRDASTTIISSLGDRRAVMRARRGDLTVSLSTTVEYVAKQLWQRQESTWLMQLLRDLHQPNEQSYFIVIMSHRSELLTVDCLGKLDDERLLTVGRDRTLRMWKVHDESQLVFRGPAASLECCCFIDGNEFIFGSDDGSIELWSSRHKKPIHIIKNAHALPDQSNRDEKEAIPDGCIKENGIPKEKKCSLAESWVSSIAVCKGSDLAVSGAANGLIRLWAIENDNKGLRPLFDYPLV
ncbi:U3 snoRNP-associated protein-like YAOH [Dioscorea cayenensis subsp. rotundata]|uniref:U3 snoRNP-associated protein-like YAOH n=1 Tax=Dioscorea cayennensis subsp. rotundata TaxID=55577 RepID=A0AB40B8J0_DIOCR|nr:U3 snoRNP-associated protein-like YAOH [Dioscorea cayenensis subsp. rotundata]